MEPESEDLDNYDNLPPFSGSDGSQELCSYEPLAESYNEEDDSESEYNPDPQTLDMSRSDPESPECLQFHGYESANDPDFLPEQSESEVSVSCQRQEEIYFCESRQSITQSPQIQTPQRSMSSTPELPDSELHTGKMSWQHSQRSSSSSLGNAVDMTRALTLSSEQLQGTSDRQGPGTGSRRVESSEEGGSSEAPPAPVFFGISDEGAEQAERRNLGSNRDLCRPDRHRARHTRLSHKESQSERRVKETKSKCKRIAQLLANAPNPQNKGALLFKKRRQRVKKYTLVSYGTGVRTVDSLNELEGEPDEVRSAEYNFAPSSDSELEEQHSLYHQQRYLNLNWGSVQEMEALPETKGKGVLMFAQRRKRMDELVSEHEELEGLTEVTVKEPQSSRTQNIYETKEMYVYADETNLMDVNLMKHSEYHENIQHMNNHSDGPNPLVPNRTAKPFLGFHDGTTAVAPDMSGSGVLVTKKHEPHFKVPALITTNPKVWSPTGDIIASRDERISVPAIKTGILPESKRKAASKQPSVFGKDSGLLFKNKGDRRSYIESEEDCFSLGAEACNFMQPRTMKLKNPPPVAPKPAINPACPPWMMSSLNEPCNSSRSPASQPSHSPVRPHGQHNLQQQNWAQPEQMASNWASDQTRATLQTTAITRVSINSSSQLHLPPTTNSWSQQTSLSPVSMQARSPTYSPHSPLANKSDSTPNSAASCPPQPGKSYVHSSKALQVSPKGHVSERGINQAGEGPIMTGKGAELFAKRQSRMEKFVIDAETIQANKTKSSSPTSSLPNSWRYSSNIRAPPPVSYNPLLSPFHPQSAAKHPLSTSPKTKTKSKEKPKPASKHLNALDIMKHQPYQLDSSLFTYDAASEAKSPSPKPTPVSKFEVAKSLKQRSASTQSYDPSELAVHHKTESPAKSSELSFGRSRSLSLPQRLNSVPSPGLLSPLSTPGIQPSFLQRQTSAYKVPHKPPTPWEAAARSPIGSVDDAFVFHSLPSSSVASNIVAAAHQKPLPEPPDEWKRRVSLDFPAGSGGHYPHVVPSFQSPSMNWTFSHEKPAFHGPPFKPAQPLRSASATFKGSKFC